MKIRNLIYRISLSQHRNCQMLLERVKPGRDAVINLSVFPLSQLMILLDIVCIIRSLGQALSPGHNSLTDSIFHHMTTQGDQGMPGFVAIPLSGDTEAGSCLGGGGSHKQQRQLKSPHTRSTFKTHSIYQLTLTRTAILHT